MIIRSSLYALLLCVLCTAEADGPVARDVEITYASTAESIPADARFVDLWLPVPTDTDGLKVGKVTIVKPEGGEISTEPRYGNRIYHHRFTPPFDAVAAELRVELHRTAIVDAQKATAPALPLSVEALRPYLEPNSLIPIDGPVAEIAAKLGLDKLEPIAAARRIYDYLIDEMTYNWRAPGAGKGDVPHVCDSKTGDCTDYNSLFLALCRHRGIPADHEFGFPIRIAGDSGRIPSWHCCARFYVAGTGWIPIDASEADKHPELREHNFGSQDANLFRFSHGRDIVLAPPQQGPPLNIFIDPYIEVDGKPHDKEKHVITFQALPAESKK